MPEHPAHSVLRQSGLDATRFEAPNLELREHIPACLARLRRLPGGPHGFEIPLPLPHRVNGVAGTDPAVLCLRPDEWLVHGGVATNGNASLALRELAARGPWVVLDESDGLAVLRLAGSSAPWLLCKVSALDHLQPAFVARAACAQTRLGRVRAIVHWHGSGHPGGESGVDVFVDRSHARYVWELLTASAPHAAELAASGKSARRTPRNDKSI